MTSCARLRTCIYAAHNNVFTAHVVTITTQARQSACMSYSSLLLCTTNVSWRQKIWKSKNTFTPKGIPILLHGNMTAALLPLWYQRWTISRTYFQHKDVKTPSFNKFIWTLKSLHLIWWLHCKTRVTQALCLQLTSLHLPEENYNGLQILLDSLRTSQAR